MILFKWSVCLCSPSYHLDTTGNGRFIHNTQFNMRGLWRELNEFFSSTSIHGFPYISDTQSRFTRIFWTLIVLAGFGVTSYFLYETVDGFSEKYVSTTVETRSINEYPFPAVTFHPGEFNSKNSFLRNILNEFEFRNSPRSSLMDNEKFLNLYQWLLYPMNDELFDDIEEILIGDKATLYTDGTYLQYYGNQFKEEVCQLIALHNKNISVIKSSTRKVFMYNIYSTMSFFNARRIIKSQVGEIIKEVVANKNITKSEISEACSDQKNRYLMTKMQAMLVSFMYLSQKTHILEDVGAGDLATGPYAPPITLATHTLLTNMYNDMINASLPVSVLNIPSLFVLPDKYFPWWVDGQPLMKPWWFPSFGGIIDLKGFDNITHEALRNYHFLWYTYYYERLNLTLVCLNRDFNCTSELENGLREKFVLAHQHDPYADEIRNNPDYGEIIEGSSTSPPCRHISTVKKFKIQSICNLLKNVSHQKEKIINIMKFTKQSPVFLEHEEYSSIFTKYGYTFRNNTDKYNTEDRRVSLKNI